MMIITWLDNKHALWLLVASFSCCVSALWRCGHSLHDPIGQTQRHKTFDKTKSTQNVSKYIINKESSTKWTLQMVSNDPPKSPLESCRDCAWILALWKSAWKSMHSHTWSLWPWWPSSKPSNKRIWWLGRCWEWIWSGWWWRAQSLCESQKCLRTPH